MFHSIKTKLIIGVSLLVIAIVSTVPFISKNVENSTTTAFDKQSKKEQINLIKSLSETQKEGLIAWMRPWYSDSNLAPLLGESIDKKKWEENLLGVGNQISIKFGVDRIITFNEDLELLNNYKVEPKAEDVNVELPEFKKILASSEDDDAITRGIISLPSGLPAIILVLPIEHEETETGFYQALVINPIPLLNLYKKSTTYSSFLKTRGKTIFLKNDLEIKKLISNKMEGSYTKLNENVFLKRIIPLPESLLGKNVDLVVFVRVTELVNSFKETESTVMQILFIMFIVSIPTLFALIFFLLKPLGVILRTSQKVLEGDYSSRSNIKSKSEIGVLSNSFNSMLNQIETKDGNMRGLLNGLTVGVFDFDESGFISSERSKRTSALFDSMEEIDSLNTFFSKFHESTDVSLALKLLFDPNSIIDFHSLVSGVLPTRIVLNQDRKSEIHIKLEYSPIHAKNKLVKVIVIAEDITKQVRAEKSSAFQKERVERISIASVNVDGFTEEVNSLSQLFNENISYIENKNSNDLPLFKRLLHTLKGNLALSNFDSCAKDVHKMETQLTDFEYSKVAPKLLEQLNQTKKDFEIYFKDISEVLGLGKDKDKDYIKVAKSKIERLESCIANGASKSIINKCIESFERYPLSIVLGKYEKYIESVSENLDKEVTLEFTKDSDEVSINEMSSLDVAFGHILRNCIDHGIEEPEAREESGKDSGGIISIKVTRNIQNSLLVEISDNGAGINSDALSKKAIENGIWSEEDYSKASEADKVNLIFNSGLSIKDEVSDTSGRGVGMDAVKSMIESAGGSIHVESVLGKGSKFTIKTKCEHISNLKVG